MVPLLRLGALGLLVACAHDDHGSGPALARCATDVELTISGGTTTPTFTWTPGCGVGALLVRDAAQVDQWYLTATTEAGIASGVRYGTVPPGAREDSAAVPLVAGRGYILYVAKGPDDDLQLAALKSFIP